jgi:hypothetical protein
MASAELEQALKQSNQQLGALTEIVDNKKTYNQKGDQLEAAIHPNNETSEPETSYDPKYPYNNSTSTESGHTFELDDTPGAERVSLSHRTGTFFEVHPNGSKVEKIVNDNVQIIVKNNEIYIMGDEKKSTQGNLKLFIKGNAKLQVDGDVELEVVGNMTMKVGGMFTAMAESFNFVGPINHVGDINCTGNIINQGNISSAKNVQAELDFVGHQDLLLTRDANIGRDTIVTRNLTAEKITLNNGIDLGTHTHPDPQGGSTSAPSA